MLGGEGAVTVLYKIGAGHLKGSGTWVTKALADYRAPCPSRSCHYFSLFTQSVPAKCRASVMCRAEGDTTWHSGQDSYSIVDPPSKSQIEHEMLSRKSVNELYDTRSV